MQLHVNTDRHLSGSTTLVARVEADVVAAIEHFEGRLTRIEVHLSDENSGRAGAYDKRCTIEARLRGHAPVAVHAHAEDVGLAVAQASAKLAHALDRLLGRLDDRRRGATERAQGE